MFNPEAVKGTLTSHLIRNEQGVPNQVATEGRSWMEMTYYSVTCKLFCQECNINGCHFSLICVLACLCGTTVSFMLQFKWHWQLFTSKPTLSSYLEPNMKDHLLNPRSAEGLRGESVHQRHILKRLNSDYLPSDAVATLTKNLYGALFSICISAPLGFTRHALPAVAVLCVPVWKPESGRDVRERLQRDKGVQRREGVKRICDYWAIVGCGRPECMCM